MLTIEQNELLTRIGRGTPMGGLIRRYWVPALLAEQLPEPDCDPVRVKLLGEPLVAFRDTLGRIGLLQELCPHRTASLFFGRNEECGIRCIYHGWKFDVEGNCVDVPTEPPTSTIKERVKARAYPCIERGGLIWTYMGPADQRPEFPAIEWTELPASHCLVTRQLLECNWFQGFEGGFDSSHLSFLHKGDLLASYSLPTHTEFVPTDSGFVYAYGRDENGQTMWTTDTMLMPFHKLIAAALFQSQIWVPIDDETTMLYCVTYHPDRPMSADELSAYASGNRIHAVKEVGSDRMAHNRDNNYGIDRSLQRSGKSFSGMKGIGVQDSAIQESMGLIADRSVEFLVTSDISVVQLRRYLQRAIEDEQAGREIPGTDPKSFHLRPVYQAAPNDVPFSDIFPTAAFPPAV